MMPRGADQLLLPASGLFIAFSLLVALLATLVPLGQLPLWPDWLAVVLVFWSVHQPRRIGVIWAFVLGLLVDVQHGAVLGQHALAYSLLSFGAVSLHRRLGWFSPLLQSLHVLPLFFLARAVCFVVGRVSGAQGPDWGYWAAPIIEALLWPLAVWLLLAPQRRAPVRDANRPL